MLRAFLPVPFLALSACVFHVGGHDHVTVDGVRLRHHHEEVLELGTWSESGLEIEAHSGDVRIQKGEGPTTLRVVVHEKDSGRAHAFVEEGRLRVHSDDGSPCAIGAVTLTTSGPVPRLHVETGIGDLELEGVAVEHELALSTGMGDIHVHVPGRSETVEVRTGMGDMDATHVECTRFSASTGMGDLRVEGLLADELELSSGMGDVDVSRSRGRRIKAGTGLGDVDVRESSFESRDLDSGLGSVRDR